MSLGTDLYLPSDRDELTISDFLAWALRRVVIAILWPVGRLRKRSVA